MHGSFRFFLTLILSYAFLHAQSKIPLISLKHSLAKSSNTDPSSHTFKEPAVFSIYFPSLISLLVIPVHILLVCLSDAV